jgi:iron(III) transport system substrate-binding protein
MGLGTPPLSGPRALTRRAFAAAGLAAPLAWSAAARPLPGYPRSYQRLEDAADREGRLLIYSAADLNEMDEVLRSFRALHPRIRVQYEHMASRAVYDRYLAEVAAGKPSADLVFNSAMDLQIKLVNDGYAQPYASPEKPYLPPWAVWKNQAYGVTAEPIVFAYNKRLMPPQDVPRSHDDLERLLRVKGREYRGKVTTYDVERSSTGFLFFTQDAQISHDTWKLLRALGKTSPRFYVAGDEMLRRVSAGEHLLAYNMMSSYALERRASDPAIEVVFPTDYTLVMSRIAFISKEARQPSAAKLFLDYLLSRQGQQLLARRYMTPVRIDLAQPHPHADPEDLRAIHVGPALLVNLDRLMYARRIAEWKEAVGR